jgi:hypothetical protein
VLAAKTAGEASVMLGVVRHSERLGADMERTDWVDEGLDAAQAQFLMMTAITHHRFSSPLWGEDEVRKLHAELAEIDLAVAQVASAEAAAKLRADRLFANNVRP